ncbi:MAG: hypothetical protein IIT42_01165 [Clostridia bacterium]|nr:hypothetical protein [Clostridia bacterium]
MKTEKEKNPHPHFFLSRLSHKKRRYHNAASDMEDVEIKLKELTATIQSMKE